MICGFGNDRECDSGCEFFKSCTRKLKPITVHDAYEKRRGSVIPIRIEEAIKFGKNFEIKSMEDQEKVESEIKRCFQKYPDIGFRTVTIAEVFDLPLKLVKEILKNVSWCKTNGTKYFYNEEYEVDEVNNVHDLLEDPEKLIKTLVEGYSEKKRDN